MNHHPRRILTHGVSQKRKEWETFNSVKPSPLPPSTVTSRTLSKSNEPVSSNQLLAGYMAYEFLTMGTLFGKKWEPARAEAIPSSALVELKRKKPEQSMEAEPSRRERQQQQTYAEVASLLKSDGTYIPGVVNPTQLARWFQM